jgi:hypothetical protein
MVKADVKQNYYEDLKLSPNATTEEIKKQYRSLGEFEVDYAARDFAN